MFLQKYIFYQKTANLYLIICQSHNIFYSEKQDLCEIFRLYTDISAFFAEIQGYIRNFRTT